MKQPVFGPTVYGIEHEYSATVSLPDDTTYEIIGACHASNQFIELEDGPRSATLEAITLEQYNEAITSLGLYENEKGMLSNGGRFYTDPSGPEYCTAETTTAAEAVLRSFDGDKIVYGILCYFQKNDFIKSFQLNRRVVDHNRSSRGVHINTATSIDTVLDYDVIDILSTLSVAKGSLFGSGGLLLNDDGESEFHHSPRLSLTDHDSISVPTYTDRALVRHPLKEDVGCRRIETITSDGLSFAWPMRASMVITNALVRLIEIEGFRTGLPRLNNPIYAAQSVGRYGNDTTIKIEENGKSRYVYPAQILQRIAELALIADVSYGQLDEESRQVLGEIILTADEIKDGPARVMERVESVARYEHMKRIIDRSDVDWNSGKLCTQDYYWDNIGRGVAEKLREQKGWGWYGFPEAETSEQTMQRLTTPPKDTRAKVRGELIRLTRGDNESEWYDFEPLDQNKPRVAMHPLSIEM